MLYFVEFVFHQGQLPLTSYSIEVISIEIVFHKGCLPYFQKFDMRKASNPVNLFCGHFLKIVDIIKLKTITLKKKKMYCYKFLLLFHMYVPTSYKSGILYYKYQVI